MCAQRRPAAGSTSTASAGPAAAALAALRPRLAELPPRDAARLRRRLDGARKVRKTEALEAIAAEIAAQIDAAIAGLAARAGAVPELSYPENLPVSAKRAEILAAIRDHQVVIIAGETGSGKTTQIPKICLELGRGVRGVIGHTQPRRLAARTVAERIAQELGTEIGRVVGYKVRFTDKGGAGTLVKLMTDGILLAELQHDRDLLQYDTLIIDEAHERSLNIDFILGYLKQLLPRRPDLKVVITSATIDPERFAAHFAAADGTPAPIVEVSGRTYPVDVRYRPIVDLDDPDGDPDRDQVQAICDAVGELQAEGDGDILVFLSGEREIRDTADALTKLQLRRTEVIPLYARLSSAEQHRVFQPHAERRVVLSTNVAETSLTVPGIKYVIDPGTARISRYSHRLKVQRLPIEPVSQASANQRKGRCGRTSDGICVRLYSEAEFLARPEFTEPEILRTNLASVILQMTNIGLGDIAGFPFVEPPDRRNIKDGLDLLHELGAVEEAHADQQPRLTPVGRKLARIPVDPRLARMVIEADRSGCLNEVLVIASALSIQDPRERPADKQAQASQSHARFVDKEAQSDFLTYLKLWDYIKEKQHELSSNQFRKLCKSEYLHYLRIREWQDLHAQLRQSVRDLDVVPNSAEAHPQSVHRALLSGLLSHIGMYDPDKREFIGARNARFAIFPGSSLFKQQRSGTGGAPRWVMAAELVETSRLWGRVAARIEPEWIEELAEHLVKRSYSEPHWSKAEEAVLAYEKATLYGIPIVAQRKTDYGRIDPELSRELFIRHALVYGEWTTRHQFFHDNRKLLKEVEELENRARRRGIVVDDETLFDFYDQRVGPECVSAKHFDTWWKKARGEQPDLLSFERSMLVNEGAAAVTEEQYPNTWRQGKLRFKLTYQFEPGADADGVTVHIPLAVLNQVEPEGFDWQIPGLREELVTELIRSLPKPIRRSFVPAPNYAKALLQQLPAHGDGRGSLLDGLEREMRRMGARDLERADWDLDRLAEHLTMTFRILDDRGRALAEGKDLAALKERLRPKLREELSSAADDLERTGMRGWELGDVPRVYEQHQRGVALKAYPALVDEGRTVGLKLLDTPREQADAMRLGVRKLLLLTIPSPVKAMLGALDYKQKLALGTNPYGPVPLLFEDCVACAADYLMERAGGPVWDAAGFAVLREKVRADLAETAEDALGTVADTLAAAHELERRLKGTVTLGLLPSLTDVRGQLARLLPKGFVSATGYEQLRHLPRYLRAISHRLDKMADDPYRDQANLARVAQLEREYEDALARVPRGSRPSAELRQARWLIEEYRVSLFAQQIGTATTVSEKRVRRLLA